MHSRHAGQKAPQEIGGVFIVNGEPRAITHPELVVGIAGPIGIDVNTISEEITHALQGVGYQSFTVRVTDEMKKYPAPGIIQEGPDYFNAMKFKMDYANKLPDYPLDPRSLVRYTMRHDEEKPLRLS